MRKKIVAMFMIYIILVATFPIMVFADTTTVTPPDTYVDSGISCADVQERYRNSYDGTGGDADKFWCSASDWFSWTCVEDGGKYGSLYIKRCLSGCDSEEDGGIVETVCAAADSEEKQLMMASMADKRLGYTPLETCGPVTNNDQPECYETDSGEKGSHICISNDYNIDGDEKNYRYLKKECSDCIAESGLCKEDIEPGQDNGFSHEMTQVNEEVEECMEDPEACEDEMANQGCTLQDRINYLCRYGPEGLESYNPPSGDWSNPGYPNCVTNVDGQPVGFSDPAIRDELNWLAITRNGLRDSGDYDPNKALSEYPDYTGSGACQEGADGDRTVERELSDCRIVRVIVMDGEIEHVLVCEHGERGDDGECPEFASDEEYESCFEEIDTIPDQDVLDALLGIIQDGDLVCDIPICEDFGPVCAQEVFVKEFSVGTDEAVQIFDPLDLIPYKISFTSANPEADDQDTDEDEGAPILKDVDREIELTFFGNDVELGVPLEDYVVHFDSSGNTDTLEGHFTPVVEGSYTLLIRLFDPNADCVNKLETYTIGDDPGLFIFVDQDQEMRDALQEAWENLPPESAADDEYTSSFRRFLQARSDFYLSERFTGVNYPVEDSAYMEAFKEYFGVYITEFVPEEEVSLVKESLGLEPYDEGKLRASAEIFELNIRNSAINFYLEMGLMASQISNDMVDQYATIIAEDATSAGFLQILGNPLRLITLFTNLANKDEYVAGLSRSKQKLADITQSFLILKSSLYGDPLIEQGKYGGRDAVIGGTASYDASARLGDWTYTYNKIRDTTSTTEDILEALGFNDEINADLLLDYTEARDPEVAKNHFEALLKAVNEYAPSVPLYKAMNQENGPLVMYGIGWMYYFVAQEAFRWTAAEDAKYRGAVEQTAYETYLYAVENFDAANAGTGSGPFWHDKMWAMRKNFLVETVGAQWDQVIELFEDEGESDYPQEVELAKKGLALIKHNIASINAWQIVDFVAGALISVVLGQWIFAAVSRLALVARIGQTLAAMGRLGKLIRFTFTAGLLIFAGKMILSMVTGTIGACKETFKGNPEDDRLTDLRKKSAQAECFGHAAQLVIFLTGPILLERYGPQAFRIGNQASLANERSSWYTNQARGVGKAIREAPGQFQGRRIALGNNRLANWFRNLRRPSELTNARQQVAALEAERLLYQSGDMLDDVALRQIDDELVAARQRVVEVSNRGGSQQNIGILQRARNRIREIFNRVRNRNQQAAIEAANTEELVAALELSNNPIGIGRTEGMYRLANLIDSPTTSQAIRNDAFARLRFLAEMGDDAARRHLDILSKSQITEVRQQASTIIQELWVKVRMSDYLVGEEIVNYVRNGDLQAVTLSSSTYDDSVHALYQMRYRADGRPGNPNLIREIRPGDPAPTLSEGAVYNYCILDDGTLVFAEKNIPVTTRGQFREVGVKHYQLADSRGVVYSGELRGSNGILVSNLRSGTFAKNAGSARIQWSTESLDYAAYLLRRLLGYDRALQRSGDLTEYLYAPARP